MNFGSFLSLSTASGAIYVRNYFNEETREAATNFVNRIQNELVDMLENAVWMGDETKAAAIKKAKAMSTYVGYPDELMDNDKLEEYYSGLELDSNCYFRSVLRIRKFELRKKIYDQIEVKPIRRNKTNDWVSHSESAHVNAFYSRLENSIGMTLLNLNSISLNNNKFICS